MKWAQIQVNRREWLGELLALAAPAGLSGAQENQASAEYNLQNANLEFSFLIRQGRMTSCCLRNKLANERVDLPETEFAFEFDGGRVADSSDFTAKVVRKNTESLELLHCGATEAVADLQVRIEYSLLPFTSYLRKQLSVRQAGKGTPRRLMRADLDFWQGVRRDWKSAKADRMHYGSHPISCETMWAGVEFVAAFIAGQNHRSLSRTPQPSPLGAGRSAAAALSRNRVSIPLEGQIS